MDRRSVLLAGGAAALAPALARAQDVAAGPDLLAAPDLKTLARNAYIFTLPAFEVGRTRDKAFAAGAQGRTPSTSPARAWTAAAPRGWWWPPRSRRRR